MGFWVLLGFLQVFLNFNVQCEKKTWLKSENNLLTDLLTSFKICSRFYFANSLLMELKSLNIIKSLVTSSTRKKTGSNLGWVFAGFFLGGFTQKNLPSFLGIYPGFWTLTKHTTVNRFRNKADSILGKHCKLVTYITLPSRWRAA